MLEVLGRGGFATVWKVKDSVESQYVAIKVLHANLAGDPQRCERFFRGAQAMRKLAHPGVVRVLEPNGEDGGFYYFVMELVTGGNLHKAVLTQRVKRGDALPLILQVGDALALAHARGIEVARLSPPALGLAGMGFGAWLRRRTPASELPPEELLPSARVVDPPPPKLDNRWTWRGDSVVLDDGFPRPPHASTRGPADRPARP